MSDEEHLGALLNPLKGYEELADILDPVTGRMMSPIGKGMKIEEPHDAPSTGGIPRPGA